MFKIGQNKKWRQLQIVILRILLRSCARSGGSARSARIQLRCSISSTHSARLSPNLLGTLRIHLNPVMLHDAFEREPIVRIVLEQLADEIHRIGRHERRTLIVDAADFRVGALVSWRLKRRLTDQQFVAQNTKTPQIHFFVMWTVFNHLRWQVVKCTANGCAA